MHIDLLTEETYKQFFSDIIVENLVENEIYDEQIHKYISELLTKKGIGEMLSRNFRASLVAINWSNVSDQHYDLLLSIGDEVLFGSSFFPEFFMSGYSKRPLGIDYYSNQGKRAYTVALDNVDENSQRIDDAYSLNELIPYYNNIIVSIWDARERLPGAYSKQFLDPRFQREFENFRRKLN